MENVICQEFLNECKTKTESAFRLLGQCFEQLDTNKIEWPPHDKKNSIGALARNMFGNFRQLAINPLRNRDGQPDDFLNETAITREKLIQSAALLQSDFLAAIGSLDPARLGEQRNIQGQQLTLMNAIFRALMQLEEHIGQIVALTRVQSDANFKIAGPVQADEKGGTKKTVLDINIQDIKAQVKKAGKKVAEAWEKNSPQPSSYSFIMTGDEKALFDKRIRDAKVYLEFGAGGSTFRVLQKSEAKVYSVESSLEWIKTIRQYRFIRNREKDRLLLFHADIGPTLEMGRPAGPGSRDLFPGYSAGIFSKLKSETIDTVLVDGRFRVACTMKTILECHANAHLQILIHDFWNREPYHIVLRYLAETGRADTLGAFAIKQNIDLDEVKEIYEQYKYNPA